MRYSQRIDSTGTTWHFMIAEKPDENWFIRSKNFYELSIELKKPIHEWLETTVGEGEFLPWPTISAVSFKTKPQAMLFKLAWDNRDPKIT